MSGQVKCSAATRQGRLTKATQFLEAADLVAVLADDEAGLVDAHVTLLVHAGIAASDVICCRSLGLHAKGTDHREAIDLLGKVDRNLANDLATLLSMKTQAGYGTTTTSSRNRARAARAAERLVERAAAS